MIERRLRVAKWLNTTLMRQVPADALLRQEPDEEEDEEEDDRKK